MLTKEEVAEILKYDNAMMLFNHMNGEEIDIESLNEENRKHYEANLYCINMLLNNTSEEERSELKDINQKCKEFGEHMLNEDKCQIAFDTIAYGGADRDEYNKCCDIIQQLIEAYFDSINNLDEVIEMQKNNLTSSYMIGLHNGLVTAKNILLKNNGNYKLLDCVENIKPYKFEELHDFMEYHDNKLNKDCLISQIYGKSILIGWYDENDGINNKWVEFEENRFYPLTKAYQDNQL